MRLVRQLQGLAHHVCRPTQPDGQRGEQNERVTGIAEAGYLHPSSSVHGRLTHSANNDAVPQSQRLPQDAKLLGDLVGQLPAWGHTPKHITTTPSRQFSYHINVWSFALSFEQHRPGGGEDQAEDPERLFGQLLQHRQHEGGRLPTPGLRAAQTVATCDSTLVRRQEGTCLSKGPGVFFPRALQPPASPCRTAGTQFS